MSSLVLQPFETFPAEILQISRFSDVVLLDIIYFGAVVVAADCGVHLKPLQVLAHFQFLFLCGKAFKRRAEVKRKMAVPSNVAELLVVRHGETTWNAVGRLQGHAESDLNDVGKQQAQAVKFVVKLLKMSPRERLASSGLLFAAIYSSDLQRAADTAQVIAEKCQCSKLVLKENLRERNLGSLQGLTRTEARLTVPKAYQALISSDDNLVIPGGGESLEQLIVRAQSAMEDIASKHHGERIVVVTHGGILRSLHVIAKGLPSRSKVTNASINTFRISDQDDWTLCSWGDVNHLQSVGYLSSAFGGDKDSG